MAINSQTGRSSQNLLQCLVGWFRNKGKARPEVRQVLLEKFDGEMVIVPAFQTDSGWIARWWNLDDQWNLLLPDGTVRGTNMVKAWMPHTGWPANHPLCVGRIPPSVVESYPF